MRHLVRRLTRLEQRAPSPPEPDLSVLSVTERTELLALADQWWAGPDDMADPAVERLLELVKRVNRGE